MTVLQTATQSGDGAMMACHRSVPPAFRRHSSGQRLIFRKRSRRPEKREAGLAAGFTKSDRWSRHSDLNRGPAVYETAALPLSYVGI